jgi:hypothetical protein
MYCDKELLQLYLTPLFKDICGGGVWRWRVAEVEILLPLQEPHYFIPLFIFPLPEMQIFTSNTAFKVPRRLSREVMKMDSSHDTIFYKLSPTNIQSPRYILSTSFLVAHRIYITLHCKHAVSNCEHEHADNRLQR